MSENIPPVETVRSESRGVKSAATPPKGHQKMRACQQNARFIFTQERGGALSENGNGQAHTYEGG